MHLNPHLLSFSSTPKDKDIKILSLAFLYASQEYQNSTEVNIKANILEVLHTRAFLCYLLIQFESSQATLKRSHYSMCSEELARALTEPFPT